MLFVEKIEKIHVKNYFDVKILDVKNNCGSFPTESTIPKLNEGVVKQRADTES